MLEVKKFQENHQLSHLISLTLKTGNLKYKKIDLVLISVIKRNTDNQVLPQTQKLKLSIKNFKKTKN